MKTKIHREIIRETEHEISFRVERRITHSLTNPVCRECAGRLVSITEAFKESEIVRRGILLLIENGEIHSTETADGRIYVCVRSVSDDWQKKID